jgi:hypothetical protein
MTLRIDLDAGNELFEVHVEVGGEIASDVTLEQNDKSPSGNRQCQQDCQNSPGNQPQPQGMTSHAGFSGTV